MSGDLPINWRQAFEIAIGGQLLAALNIGTLYYKKGDGAAVRTFANSHARICLLLQQLLDTSNPIAAREKAVGFLKAEVVTMSSKEHALDSSLHPLEADLANEISDAAGDLKKALAGHLQSHTARNPRLVFEKMSDALSTFGVQ